MLSWLTAGVVGAFTEPLLKAYQMSLSAENDADKRAAELNIQRLESARAIALVEATDRWSATRLGRLLIVLPFGIWWASIFFVSITGVDFTIKDIPPRIWDMASWLIPAIIIGDIGQTAVRAIRK